MGLFNTNKRLKLRYNDLYSLRIRSKQGFGTMVEIPIPIEEDRHE
ncbi:MULTISPECIES: hypothetical protein [Paenibacillus]|nr:MULTISPECIES: hypothetical protein [Paenibacillus]